MFPTTCVSSDVGWAPKARFQAGNEATSQQTILLLIRLIFSIYLIKTI